MDPTVHHRGRRGLQVLHQDGRAFSEESRARTTGKQEGARYNGESQVPRNDKECRDNSHAA
eukprot:5440705-Lingulodinium_polyedra.AAC.1